MRQLHFDLRRLQKDDRQGSHGSRRARGYVLAQAAETLHQLGYRGLRAKGLKGRHIEALVAEWRRQGLTDGTVENRMAHLRWLARKIGKPGIVRRDNASYGVGARCGTWTGTRSSSSGGPAAARTPHAGTAPSIRETVFGRAAGHGRATIT